MLKTISFQEVIADTRVRGHGLDPDDLDALIEEARTAFYRL